MSTKTRTISCPYMGTDPRAVAYVDGWLDGWKSGRLDMRDEQIGEGRERSRFYGRWWSISGLAVALVAGVMANTSWAVTGMLWLAFGVFWLVLSEVDR